MNDTLQFLNVSDSNRSVLLSEKLIPKITLGVFLSSLAIFTVLGNILVLYAIRIEKHLRTVSNLFILSLAFADLAVGLFVMPLSAATIVTGRWPFSSLLCKLWLSIDYVASTASIFNLVLLSLDRYWAVVYPLRYLRKRTRRRATIFILTVWFISSLWAPAVIFWSFLVPQHSDIIEEDECDTSFRSNKTFKTLTALVNFYVPLLTMIIISIRIMIAIRSRSKLELGRRLSSTTQKRMKSDRSSTNFSPRQETLIKTEENHRRSSLHTITDNPSDDRPMISNSLRPIVERGQCFCSTCQTTNSNDNESLWELQEMPVKKTFTRHLPFVPLKTISMIFSSPNSSKKSSVRRDRTVSSTTTSNETKDVMIIDSNQCSPVTPSIKVRKSAHVDHSVRTSSITSSFSDDLSEITFTQSKGKSVAMKKLLGQTPTLSNHSSSNCHFHYPSVNTGATTSAACFLKVPLKATTTNDSISPLSESSTTTIAGKHSNRKMTLSTFINNLINPSQSNSLQKELKAARQLGMLVGVFTVSWLPYFILFLVVAWCNQCVSNTVFTASIWLGYLNSTFNPLIYPLCNVHFRRAFQKICHCKHGKTKLPNLNALRELQTLHTMTRRRRR